MQNKLNWSICMLLLISSCKQVDKNLTITNQKEDIQLIKVLKANTTPVIDGVSNDAIWTKCNWHPINELWLGEKYTAEDFQGKYKLSWTKEALYMLVEIQDDVLLDQNKNPLMRWWADDCVEIFIDEDNSGGNHQYNHNAFAYHVALDGNVVDMAPDESPKLYNNHVQSKKITNGTKTIWELKILLFNDSYKDDEKNNPVKLSSGKKVGFAIAYCDNDASIERENFIGSIPVLGGNKDRGWIDANIFGTLLLEN